ncbi:ABC transporter substrate-binding protein [Halobellus ruber]|uniref:Extracellular solute-binding protein n=1 Tax=Halobellus ruber TaxID=2761102 RepID=A0A7J9SMJ0_9EURY|nr:extracellular solute-binding protein [Halobellus ruber]MBB6647286.1 extracellular solute-binding protein [Halobellus ruber]
MSSRRQYLAGIGAGAATLTAGCVGSITGGGGSTLKLLDWNYVYADGILDRFERETGVPVELQAAQSSAQSLSLLRSGRSDHDIVALGNYAVPPAIEEGLLQPVDLEQVPAYDDILNVVKKEYFRSDGSVYGVPRSFGQTPLAVNTEMIDDDITSLAALFDDAYGGMIGGRDDARLQILYERAAAGTEPLNPTSADAVDFDRLRERLATHVDLSGGLWSSGGESEQLLRSGEVGVQPVWNYVISSMRDAGVPVERVYPEEGTKAWFIQFCIPESAENVEAAHRFIQEWHAEFGYESLMAPSNIAVPNERVFRENNVELSAFGLDDPSRFIYEEPKPQSLIEQYVQVWTEAKSAAGE